MMQNDIISRLEERYKSMSKGHKAIAQFIMNNYDKAAFMTASKLGDKVGVSESTVVRFAIVLGYDGYPMLQKSLQEMIRNKLTSVQRIELSSKMEQSAILSTVLKADMQNIRMTIDEIDNDTFDRVVDALLKARKVYIMGVRSAEPLAQFLAHYLNYVLEDVELVTLAVSDVYEHFLRMTKDDVCIGISFPRYSQRTIDGMSFAKETGATVVALTDSKNSPLAAIADATLTARSDMVSFVDSLVAPLSVINALLVAVSGHRKEAVSEYFAKLEALWKQHSVYSEKGNVQED